MALDGRTYESLVYRRNLTVDVVAFTAKTYHGHRAVPTTMDQLVDELRRFNQHTDAVKLKALLPAAEKREE